MQSGEGVSDNDPGDCEHQQNNIQSSDNIHVQQRDCSGLSGTCPDSVSKVFKSSERLNEVHNDRKQNEMPVDTEEYMLHFGEEGWPGWIPDENTTEDPALSPDVKLSKVTKNGLKLSKMNKNDDECALPLDDEFLEGKDSLKSVLALKPALLRQKDIITTIWPTVAEKARKEFPDFLNMYQTIKRTNAPNFVIARIPVPSGLMVKEWEKRLADYHDRFLCDFLRFGWPIGYHAKVQPDSVSQNHPSATANIQHVREFIVKELQWDAIVGPFEHTPFTPWCRISPIMTRPKRESSDRRIILDLSFPKGRGVNDGITTSDHYGLDITYSLPSIADLIEVIKTNGRGSMMWKTDLTRAYRQLRADPLDAPLLGMAVDGKIYIDRCPPFGCRSSAALCQRVANSLVFMMANMGHRIIAYLDDFAACCSSRREAQNSYNAFIHLAKDLGLKLAEHKSCPPTTHMEWLGYEVDTCELKISIPADKLNQVIGECELWLKKEKANKRMVQSIAGRLIYIANAIPPARKFTSRILGALRCMDDHAWITLSQAFKADLRWFVEFGRLSNGIFLFSPVRPIVEVECDSSLMGGGGLSHPFCYSWKYTDRHKRSYPNIHHLEALNILVAYQTLAARHQVHPAKVIVFTDNMASACALSSGKGRDEVLSACARQLWLLASTNSHEIIIQHKNGSDIPISDGLSRMSHDKGKAALVYEAVSRLNLQFVNPVINDYVFFASFL